VGSFGAKFAVMTRRTLEDRQFERVTLGQIKNRTRDGDLVLYIHSKGAYPYNQRRHSRSPVALLMQCNIALVPAD